MAVTTSKLSNQILFSAVFMLRSLNNMQCIVSGIIVTNKVNKSVLFLISPITGSFVVYDFGGPAMSYGGINNITV